MGVAMQGLGQEVGVVMRVVMRAVVVMQVMRAVVVMQVVMQVMQVMHLLQIHPPMVGVLLAALTWIARLPHASETRPETTSPPRSA